MSVNYLSWCTRSESVKQSIMSLMMKRLDYGQNDFTYFLETKYEIDTYISQTDFKWPNIASEIFSHCN